MICNWFIAFKWFEFSLKLFDVQLGTASVRISSSLWRYFLVRGGLTLCGHLNLRKVLKYQTWASASTCHYQPLPVHRNGFFLNSHNDSTVTGGEGWPGTGGAVQILRRINCIILDHWIMGNVVKNSQIWHEKDWKSICIPDLWVWFIYECQSA